MLCRERRPGNEATLKHCFRCYISSVCVLLTYVLSGCPHDSHKRRGEPKWLINSFDRYIVHHTSYNWTELMPCSWCFRRESHISESLSAFFIPRYQHGVAGGREGARVEGPLDGDDGVVCSHHWQEMWLI